MLHFFLCVQKMTLNKMDYLPPTLYSVALLAKDISNQHGKRWQNQSKTCSAHEIFKSFCISIQV